VCDGQPGGKDGTLLRRSDVDDGALVSSQLCRAVPVQLQLWGVTPKEVEVRLATHISQASQAKANKAGSEQTSN